MEPVKFFNFAMPFEMYQKLKRISIESELPIAALVRQGVEYVLRSETKRIAQEAANG